jgi:hypothetical protein
MGTVGAVCWHRPAAAAGAALLAASLTAAPAAASAQGTVRGVVYDSLVVGGPLAAAEVWIDGLPFSTEADAAGRFTLAGVPAGRHRVTFSHPALGRFGFGAPVRDVVVAEGAAVDAALATPSAGTVYAALCPGVRAVKSGVIVGNVVAPSGRVARPDSGGAATPAAGARAVASWSAITVEKAGVVRAERVVEARADSAGRFRLCGVPTDIPVHLVAEARDGGVAARMLDLRDGVVGVATVSVPPPAAPGPGDAVPGAAVVAGTVQRPDGRPAAGARVSVRGEGESATAGDDGRFVLRGVRPGTLVVEARLLGTQPAAARVTLAAGRVTRLTLGLGARVVVLAPTTVREAGVASALAGFEERRRRGAGQFVTGEQMRERGHVTLYDALVGVPGLTVRPPAGPGRAPLLSTARASGQFGVKAGGCQPLVYLDGARLTDVTSLDGAAFADVGVGARDLYGIEVHQSLATAPPQYQALDGGCGVVLVWTRRAAMR